MPIVTLTTDFGADIYAAVMKGVILGINPRAVVVDITHSVHPQSVEEGAFLTQAAWPY
ncbi:MAG TPA: SAM-dependent chlorinase/fluorinase, partial [Dehalococcoidia bacterium]|nr:SAM-dependent chlorinase/fluorinase [Dehalococcoidia bacterium]